MDCIFCKIINKEIPSNILYEDEDFLAFLDLDQTHLGHTLIILKKHIEDYTKLQASELKKMFEIANTLSLKIMSKLHSKGISLNFNYGSLQEIKHVHLHICPDKENKEKKTLEEIYSILKDDN